MKIVKSWFDKDGYLHEVVRLTDHEETLLENRRRLSDAKKGRAKQ